MFSGFWSWFLVIVFVVAIFNAHRLPEFKKQLENLSKGGIDALKKGTKTAQEKIAQAKAKAERQKTQPEEDNNQNQDID